MELHPTARRVQERLAEAGLDVEVRELADSTRTAQEAAAAVDAEIGQIVKSLVFVDRDGALLCLCAGDRRVDPAKLGQDVRQARGDEVREATGFSIGGVPPLGHCGRSSTSRSGASTPSGAPAARPTRSFRSRPRRSFARCRTPSCVK
jgi:prolyl-tRNA editing enzyme YbaK/EbsC (Cys-tRNA(Pro) deacylase)